MTFKRDGWLALPLYRYDSHAHFWRLSDRLGRKRILIGVAFLYALSAILSALAISYTMLYVARMIGGVAFGAALILAQCI